MCKNIRPGGGGGGQVVCGLGSCPNGEDSVGVEAEVTATQGAASRMLAAVGAGAQHSQSQSHRRQEMLRRVRNRAPQHRQLEAGAAVTSSRDPTTFWPGQRQELGRRRRLGDIAGVEFKLPTGEGTEGDDGEVLTESQLAAAFINNVADPVRRTAMHRVLDAGGRVAHSDKQRHRWITAPSPGVRAVVHGTTGCVPHGRLT